MNRIVTLVVMLTILNSSGSVAGASTQYAESSTALEKTETVDNKLTGGVTAQQPDSAGESNIQNPFDENLTAVEESQIKDSAALKKIGNKGKSLANFVFDLRGFDWSKEGADALLDTDVNLKNELGREYNTRKQHDEKELKKAELLLEIALYVDRDLSKTTKAVAALAEIIGKQEAQRKFLQIQSLQSSTANISPQASTLDFEQRRALAAKIYEGSVKEDAVIRNASSRLSMYNHRSKSMRTTAKIVYSSLGVATFTPTLVAPIAETALLSFMMATGGPEQDKLLKEIYLSKIMESRYRLLNEKTHLVIESVDIAQATQNKRLLICSQYLLQQMTKDEALVRSIVNKQD